MTSGTLFSLIVFDRLWRDKIFATDINDIMSHHFPMDIVSVLRILSCFLCDDLSTFYCIGI